MPSPFPGMDPWLEGALWPDFHQALATEIRSQLAPRLRPRYVARLAVSVARDVDPETELTVVYPDVEVLESGRRAKRGRAGGAVAVPESAAPLTIPVPEPVRVRLVTVQVRQALENRLVASIEILSPVNKRRPGSLKLMKKWRRLRKAGVHLIEIDLLRRGRRLHPHDSIPDVPYLAYVTRAEECETGVWPIGLREPLPAIPVPLLAPDPDVFLDLSAAVARVYDEAAYELSIDYGSDPPSPEFAEADRAWLARQAKKRKG